MKRILTISSDKAGYYKAVIFPYLDTHQIPLLDERWTNDENPIRYIANSDGHILYKISGKFFMFDKNGALICEVDIEDEDDKETLDLKALSPNGKFLVYEIRCEQMD